MARLVHPPKRRSKNLLESFTEWSKNIRHLPRYLSIQRDPKFFSAYHHWDHMSRQSALEARILELLRWLAA